MASLEAALEALKSSDPVIYAATARQFKYDETTFQHCHQRKQV